jgi:glycosyltransferase involved in cell wall biosynthesis
MNVCILTRSLTRGGAQVQVVALAKGLVRRGHVVSVVSFYGGGALAESVRTGGVQLFELGKTGRLNVLSPLRRLVTHLKQSGADVIYSFLPMENLFGLVAARLTRRPIVWGIRGAAVNRDQYGIASRILYGLQFRLLGCADAVICNSQAAALEIPAPRRMRVRVVPNGIDTDRFAPSIDRRLAWRLAGGFTPEAKLVGIVARLDPMKDHSNFIRGAVEVARRVPEATFVIAGGGSDDYASSLRQLAVESGVAGRMRWLGEIADPAEVYCGLDVMVSASAYGEGFSNALGEAMATGLAVVATDVGDSRLLVSDHGVIVPPRDAQALAEGIIAVLARDSDDAQRARARWIRERFGVDAMVVRTEDVLVHVCGKTMTC